MRPLARSSMDWTYEHYAILLHFLTCTLDVLNQESYYWPGREMCVIQFFVGEDLNSITVRKIKRTEAGLAFYHRKLQKFCVELAKSVKLSCPYTNPHYSFELNLHVGTSREFRDHQKTLTTGSATGGMYRDQKPFHGFILPQKWCAWFV
jgi:hypothetical protein